MLAYHPTTSLWLLKHAQFLKNAFNAGLGAPATGKAIVAFDLALSASDARETHLVSDWLRATAHSMIGHFVTGPSLKRCDCALQ